jgi:hypothetical protein
MYSDVEEARHRPRGGGVVCSGGGSQTYRTLKFVVGFFELDSVLLTEGSILRNSNFANKCRWASADFFTQLRYGFPYVFNCYVM